MKSILFLMMTLLFACSKSNVSLEDKAPNIEVGQRIDALHAIYMIDRARNEEDLLVAIRDISENYSSDFDWNKFFSDVNRTGILRKSKPETIKSVLKLNDLACPQKDHTELFRLIDSSLSDIEYLNYVLESSRCPKNIPASVLAKYLSISSDDVMAKTLSLVKKSRSTLVDFSSLWNSLGNNESQKYSHLSIVGLVNAECSQEDVNNSILKFLKRALISKTLSLPDVFMNIEAKCFADVKEDLLLSFLRESGAREVTSFFKYLNRCKDCFLKVDRSRLGEVFLLKVAASNPELLREGKTFFSERKNCEPGTLANILLIASAETVSHDLLGLDGCVPVFKNQYDLELTVSNIFNTYNESEKYPVKEVAKFIISMHERFSEETLISLASKKDFINFILKSLYENNETELFSKILGALRKDSLDSAVSFVQYHFSKDESFALKTIQNFGIKNVLRMLDLAQASRMDAWILRTELTPTETVKYMGQLFIKEIARLGSESGARIRQDLLEKAFEGLEAIDKLIVNALLLSKNEQLKTMLIEKSKVLLNFEESFRNHKEYSKYLELHSLHSTDATLLLIRSKYRSILSSKEERNYDMTSIASNFERAKEEQDNSLYRKVMSSYTEMWLYDDVIKFNRGMNEFCRILETEGSDPVRPGCYTFDKGLTLSTDPEWSLYSYVKTNGNKVTVTASTLRAGILDASNTTKPGKVPVIKTLNKYNAWAIPAVIQLYIPTTQDGPFIFEEDRTSIKSENTIFFRYYFVHAASTPPLAREPEQGLQGGEIYIQKDLRVLPRLVSFGSEGELPSDVTIGGKGLVTGFSDDAFKKNATFLPKDNAYDFTNSRHHLAHDWSPMMTISFFEKLTDYLSGGRITVTATIDLNDNFYEYCLAVHNIKNPTDCSARLSTLTKSRFMGKFFGQIDDETKLPFSVNNVVTLFGDTLTLPGSPDLISPYSQGPRGERGLIKVGGKAINGELK